MRLEELKRDLLIASRGLRRAPGFTGGALLTLSIGIAATTVMFALIEGVLLRPLPIPNQDRVIVAWKELRASAFAHYPFGGPDVEAVSDTSELLEVAGGVTSNGTSAWVAIENGAASYVNGALVTGNFFRVLGIEPILGRPLTVADDVKGAEKVVVISSALWHKRYGASPTAIGRRLELGGEPFTIVGVMPGDVDYPRHVELWRPVNSVRGDGPFDEAARYEVDLIARMRPGVTIEQTATELGAVTKRLASTAPPDFPRTLIPVVRSFEDVITGSARTPLLLLFAAVLLVLLIANANAANLLLLRSEGRRRELAVRIALGAGRGRILTLVLAESVLLATVAGVVGVALAWWSLRPLGALAPDGLPRLQSVRMDAVVILFSVATVLATALLAGTVPAIFSARADHASQLRTSSGGTSRPIGRRALVGAQVALAVVVLTTAGLLVRSLLTLRSVEMGLSADRLVFVNLALPPAKVMDRARHEQFLDEVVNRLVALPSIAAVTPVNVAPFSGDAGWDVPRFTAEGQSPDRAATNPSLNLESVHPAYFETFGIPILRGRAFTMADRQGTAAVAIVSADVAARTWGRDDPIGKRLRMGGPDSDDEWRTIVGVAAPTRYRELAMARPTLYLPATQFLMTAGIVVLRTTAPVENLLSIVREHISSIDADARVLRVARFSDMLDVPLARPRFHAYLLSLFAVLAVALAMIGLYAVIASTVRQRQREIGIRIALGASSENVRRLVLQEALSLSAVGAAAGLAGSVAATRLTRSILFGVEPLDPSTLVGSALTLIAASALAAYVPMRRAARVDPVAMLRAE